MVLNRHHLDRDRDLLHITETMSPAGLTVVDALTAYGAEEAPQEKGHASKGRAVEAKQTIISPMLTPFGK